MKKFLFLFGTNCFLFGAITLAGTIDDAVNWAYENDLTVFNTPTSFWEYRFIRRDEATKFFVQFSNLFDAAFDDKPEEVSHVNQCQFLDLAQAHTDLVESIVESCKLWIFQWSNGKFYPSGELTNAQAIAVVIRILDDGQRQLESGLFHWADNYYKRAKELWLDISQFADREAPATRGRIITMLYHTSQFISNLLLSNGVNALKDGRISKGLQWTEKALTRSPTNTDAYAFLSNISYSLEEYEDALALLTHTIELSPKDYQPYVSRWDLYSALSAEEEAIKNYTVALQLIKNDESIDSDIVAVIYNNRWNSYQKLGNQEKAIEDTTTAIELDSYNPVYYITRGNSYEILRQTDEAREDYESARKLTNILLQRSEENGSVWYYLLEEIEDRLTELH